MYERIFKRVLDILGSLLFLIILSPLLLVVTLLAWFIQGWPVVFTQERAGYRGRKFRIYKFRSMRDTKGPDGQLLPDDQRTTRFGRFLRDSSFDELPGLLNVLKGEMSFIGPRALICKYLPYYTEEEYLRHTVRPGMVGYAGVHGRNDLNWDIIFEYDTFYAKKCSLALDLHIFFRTFVVVLKRQGIEMVRLPLDEYRNYQPQRQVTEN